MALIGFWQNNQPYKNWPHFFRAKNGQNRPKWPYEDINGIKNFCFLHHTSPKSYLEHGLNHFVAKKSAQKNLPQFLGQKMAKIGQNRPKSAKVVPEKMIMISKNFCFWHHTSPKSSLEYGPNRFLAKKSDQKIDTTL
jgi:hypothetical protein